jgi:DNA-binding NarL/FixJ family response regulator
MLRDIVREIVKANPDMRIVGDVHGSEELAAIAERPIDCVLVGDAGDDLPKAYVRVLVEHPKIRLVTISAERRDACLYELRLQKTPLGELTAETLLKAISPPDREWP